MTKESTINYISNSSLNEISGGWNGLNFQIHEIIKTKFKVNYIGPIFQSVNKFEKFYSKGLRLLNFKAPYYFYSDYRLKKIKSQLLSKVNNENPIVFFGATPYLDYCTEAKYYVVTDISFKGYYDHYNNDEFSQLDINRIMQKEKQFFKKAEKVFFTSNWALSQTKVLYDMDGINFFNIGIGGNISENYSEDNNENLSLLYISQDFGKKGGYEVYDAFKELFNENDKLQLHIIGGMPPEDIINHPGVTAHGFINKSNKDDLLVYRKLLSSSSLLILPTKSDAAPLTIIECGYFGTPSIAPARFAIPEMVKHNESGFLLKEDFTVKDIVHQIKKFEKLDEKNRNDFRKNTFDHYIKNHSWKEIGNRLIKEIEG